jgi:hypothetical protein
LTLGADTATAVRAIRDPVSGQIDIVSHATNISISSGKPMFKPASGNSWTVPRLIHNEEIATKEFYHLPATDRQFARVAFGRQSRMDSLFA